MHGIERSPVSAIISASPLATDCCIGFPTAIIFLALRLSMPVRFVSSTTAYTGHLPYTHTSRSERNTRVRPFLHSEHSANETRMIQPLARVSNPSPSFIYAGRELRFQPSGTDWCSASSTSRHENAFRVSDLTLQKKTMRFATKPRTCPHK